MQCLRPIWVKKKTGTVLRASHFLCPERNWEGVEQVQVPCGKCEACQSNYRQQWTMRLIYEYKSAKTAAFCTLTYAPEHLYFNDYGVPSVNKRDVQLFMKRLRKKLGVGIRYFLMSEYGDDPRFTQRPHYHFLLFNYPPMAFLKLGLVINECWNKTDKYFQLAKVAEPVTGRRISYCAGYAITRKVGPYRSDPNFMLCSRRPAIGSSFLTENSGRYLYDTAKLSVNLDKGSYPVHRYFRDKISDDDFKERCKQEYESYTKRKNASKYGFEDFSLTWNTAEVAAHGLTQEQYNLLCHNENERLQSWVNAFRKKQKHKHIKI